MRLTALVPVSIVLAISMFCVALCPYAHAVAVSKKMAEPACHHNDGSTGKSGSPQDQSGQERMVCCDQTWLSVSKYSVPFQVTVTAIEPPAAILAGESPAFRPVPAFGAHACYDTGQRLASVSVLRI